jgi:P27 family predicted phage terminase small subunit
VGRRGPAPAPDAAKLARGETRPSRLNGLEPLPRRRLPTMPRDMSAEAKMVWRRVLRAMAAAEVITEADRDVLRAYCEAVALYERDVRLLAGAMPLVQGARNRELVRNPLHQIVRDDRDAIRLLSRELGLSPSARANLQIGSGGRLPAACARPDGSASRPPDSGTTSAPTPSASSRTAPSSATPSSMPVSSGRWPRRAGPRPGALRPGRR